MSFAVGSLVRARGREWVVLPETTDRLLMLRPLGGSDEEVAGVVLGLEAVEPATFQLPDPAQVGGHMACRLLYDAVRLGLRSSAGPFRSFGRIGVEPRSYQLVPLLMALKQDPVRLLIADDVGIGKTVEACLIAKELLERGEVQRLAVLCPPHLAEQWQEELWDKFHIEAELVLSHTVARLERGLPLGKSLFEVHPHTIVSMDFIKSDDRRSEFVRSAPELVIIDEAHTCAYGVEGRGRHQRHQLVRDLAADPGRHLLLVTATPHSGKPEAFRSLLAFLDPSFAALPDDLSGEANRPHRTRLANHLVQRMRGDIRHFMQEETPFPDREETEISYSLSPEYRRLFDKVLKWAREIVRDASGGERRQRVRWWSALALLRSLASSPAAAEQTLHTRAAGHDADSVAAVDDTAAPVVLDLDPDDTIDGADTAPGADSHGDEPEDERERAKLRELEREARKLRGEHDSKLLDIVPVVRNLVRDGYHPIIFCRFIPTSDYVAEELRRRLARQFADLKVESVTGVLAAEEREQRVDELSQAERRILVCTDCLSEGINLQEHFNAVIHYDLSWNPTRHDQRAGRVDRFNQKSPVVRVLTYYGLDNQIDGIVLDVLIRKHASIRQALGVSVSIPTDSGQVMKAIYEGLLLRGQGDTPFLPGFEQTIKAERQRVHTLWEGAAAREKRSRTLFAQETIKPAEVSQELRIARDAVGGMEDVRRFVRDSLRLHQGSVTDVGDRLQVGLREVPRALMDRLAMARGVSADKECLLAFSPPAPEHALALTRTHPFVEGLASYVLDSALDPIARGLVRRCGAIPTRAVAKRTTALVVRLRHHIVTKRKVGEHALLVEECRVVAFTGAPSNAGWLDDEAAVQLLTAAPAGDLDDEARRDAVGRVLDRFDDLRPHLDDVARRRAAVVFDSHNRVRQAAKIRGMTLRVEPMLPIDILGLFVFMPV